MVTATPPPELLALINDLRWAIHAWREEMPSAAHAGLLRRIELIRTEVEGGTTPNPELPESVVTDEMVERADRFGLTVAERISVHANLTDYDQRFCDTHGMFHSVEMRDPDCYFYGEPK